MAISSFSLSPMGGYHPGSPNIFNRSVKLYTDERGVETWQDQSTGKIFTNDPAKSSTLDKIVKILAIAGVGAGYGAAGLAAAAPETAAGLGLGSGASASGLAAPVTAQGGFSLFGGTAVPPAGYVAGSDGLFAGGTLAANPGWLTTAAPYLAGGGLAAGGLDASGAFDGGQSSGFSSDQPAGYDASGNPTYSSPELTPTQQAILNAPGEGGLTTSNIIKALPIASTGASLLGGAGGAGGLGTTTTTQNLSPQQLAYQQVQQQIAEKQLELLGSQGSFQQGYLDSIKPLLDQQAKLMQQQYDAFNVTQNDPATKEIQARANDLLLSQIQSQSDLAPLQKQLLQAQLQQALGGGNPTPEQIASIDAATRAAQASGTSDINAYASDALTKLGQELAPGLGLRPTDTPIQDRASLIAREATRQVGQLAQSLAGANAQARLNYPLAQQQVSNATAANTQAIAEATQKFQADLAQNAIQNRLNLLTGGRGATDLGLTSGSNLVSASRGNPLNFGGSTTVSNPGLGLSSLLGGVGSLATGLDSTGWFSR